MKQEFFAQISPDGKTIDFQYKNEVKFFLNELKGQEVIVSIEKKTERRTPRQNNALHLFFQLLADALNEAGLDMRKVIKQDIDIEWTLESVKDYLWRPIQKVLLKKTSTTKLNKKEDIDKIYDTLNRHLSEKFGVSVPFPSEEQIILNL